MPESNGTVTIEQDDTIGRNVCVVDESEKPMNTMQSIDHLSEDELGIVSRDRINGDTRWFKYSGDGLWIEYFEDLDRFDAHQPDYLSNLLTLGGEQAVVPVAAMPFFGDDSLDLNDIFE